MHKIFDYLRWYWHARTVYSLHSPLLYDFANNVVEDDRYYYAFDDVPQRFGHVSDKHSRDEHDIGQLLFKTTLWWKPDIIFTNHRVPETLNAYIKATDAHNLMLTSPPCAADMYDPHANLPGVQRLLFVFEDLEECNPLFAQGLPKAPVCLFLWNMRNPRNQRQGMPIIQPTILYIDLYHLGVLISGPDIIRAQTMNVIAARKKPFRLGWI